MGEIKILNPQALNVRIDNDDAYLCENCETWSDFLLSSYKETT